jgi:hypothetical protein
VLTPLEERFYPHFEIQHKDPLRGFAPYEPKPAQIDLLGLVNAEIAAERPVRMIVLKARQVGLSTAVQMRMMVEALTLPGFTGLTLNKRENDTQYIFNMAEMAWRSLPKGLRVPRAPQGNKAGLQTTFVNKSRLRTETAQSKAGGRSTMARWLHATEVAFYPYAREIFVGIKASIPERPGTLIVMESTALGQGNYFHQQWTKAERGESDYVPFFVPWPVDPDYTMPLDARQQDALLADLDEYEQRLYADGVAYMGRPWPVTAGNLAWRRHKLRNDFDDESEFMQENPASPHEAFQSSSRSYFGDLADKIKTRPALMTGDLEEDRSGRIRFVEAEGRDARRAPLKLHRLPIRDGRLYVVFVDTAGRVSEREWEAFDDRTDAEDYNVAYVLDGTTGENVAKWRMRAEPDVTVTAAIQLCFFYGGFDQAPLLAFDTTGGHGNAQVQLARDRGYPRLYSERIGKEHWSDKPKRRYGLTITSANRHVMLSTLKRWMRDEPELFPDEDLRSEMAVFVKGRTGEGAAAPGFHDDVVMAAAGAFHVWLESGGVYACSPPKRGSRASRQAGVLPSVQMVTQQAATGADEMERR